MEKTKKLAVGILAHVDAGKTTLAEGILYKTGQIRKAGRVDHKDAFLDTEELEKARGENAVVVDDGITCAGDLRSRRNLVCQFAHDIFARHGDVPASCTHGAESFDCLRHFVFRYIKGKVAIIKAELVACFVVHFRRNTVCNRASE